MQYCLFTKKVWIEKFSLDHFSSVMILIQYPLLGTGKRQGKIKSSFLIAAIVVVSFFLCWAPFHAQRLGYIYLADSTAFKDVFEDISDELM